MEARAIHNFVATADDELSFEQSDTLKIMDTTKDRNWYRAEKEGKEGFIPNNYIEWKKPSWYVENVNRMEAERMLIEKDEKGGYYSEIGAFLVRNSESSAGEYSLSVKTSESDDTVQHFKILREYGKYYLWNEKFTSINKLVDHHRVVRVNNDKDNTREILLKDMARPKKLLAMYDFTAEAGEEVSFRKGDVIMKTGENCNNWWRGIVHGKEGLFPAAYVREISDVQHKQSYRFTQGD